MTPRQRACYRGDRPVRARALMDEIRSSEDLVALQRSRLLLEAACERKDALVELTGMLGAVRRRLDDLQFFEVTITFG